MRAPPWSGSPPWCAGRRAVRSTAVPPQQARRRARSAEGPQQQPHDVDARQPPHPRGTWSRRPRSPHRALLADRARRRAAREGRAEGVSRYVLQDQPFDRPGRSLDSTRQRGASDPQENCKCPRPLWSQQPGDLLAAARTRKTERSGGGEHDVRTEPRRPARDRDRAPASGTRRATRSRAWPLRAAERGAAPSLPAGDPTRGRGGDQPTRLGSHPGRRRALRS